MKEHHKCSASRNYTHTVYPTFPPGSEPEERRKEDGFRSRFQQHVGVRMVEKPQPSVDSKQGESTRGGRKREKRDPRNLSQIKLCEEKRHPTPPYIGQGGVPLSLPFPSGTKP